MKQTVGQIVVGRVFAVVSLIVGGSFIMWGFQHLNDPTRRLWGSHWFGVVCEGAILCILGGIVSRQVFFKKRG